MIALIAARSKNNVIGRKGRIPWKIKGEQNQFKELTTGNVVIIGRMSFEGIGHQLSGRTVIIVSGSKQYHAENITTTGSLNEALSLAGDRNIYIAGGYELYREALPIVDKMYITEIDLTIVDGDVFFPDFNTADFNIIIEPTVDGEIRYTRTIYTRKTRSIL